MPQVSFTQNLARHLPTPSVEVTGATVRDALEAVFGQNPPLRSYVLDDQGRLRKHVMIFIDGEMVGDRRKLSDTVGDQSEIFVMQALSGG